jgi:predicted amidohydrolase YtcJ
MLIKNTECLDLGRVDVRISGAHVSEIAQCLSVRPGEDVIDARGNALLPGLRDHHLHLYAAAAALNSVDCGPPQVTDQFTLADTITKALAYAKDTPWIRGFGYHESIAGMLDREAMDRLSPTVPLRIQHRSGRLWFFNSAGLRELGISERNVDDPFERSNGQLTGRLYDADGWLRGRTGQGRMSLVPLSKMLAAHGIVGVTDAGQNNDIETLKDFATLHARGALLQDVRVMGNETLDHATPIGGITRGERKFHLHEHDLPPFDDICAAIQRSHACGRRAAFHCTTRTELFFALGALEAARALPGDRIEHASVAPDDAFATFRKLGIQVVTQPGFVATRGDSYQRDVEDEDQPWLYRLSSFVAAGIPIAAGSDAPFGDLNPWKAMHAAVTRKTHGGADLGAREALSPEQALRLYTSDLASPGTSESIRVGGPADLCLLTLPWSDAREALDTVIVEATFNGGRCIYSNGSAP